MTDSFSLWIETMYRGSKAELMGGLRHAQVKGARDSAAVWSNRRTLSIRKRLLQNWVVAR